MNNGQFPPGGGGGGNPPQLPAANQLIEVLQAAQAQARVQGQAQAFAHLARADPQQQAQLIQAVYANPQQMIMNLQQVAHAHLQAQLQNPLVQQQVQQRFQQEQQERFQQARIQEEMILRNAQVQDLLRLIQMNHEQQRQDVQDQQMQLQLPDMQREQHREQHLQQIEQQLQQLVWNRQAMGMVAQPPPLPVHVPAVQRNPPPLPSPAQRAMAANSPAMNQIQNFINQEENNALRGPRILQPQPVRPAPQPPVAQRQQPIHIPELVRYNNLLVQAPAQQLLLQPVQQVHQNQVPPAQAPAPQPQEPLVEQVAQPPRVQPVAQRPRVQVQQLVQRQQIVEQVPQRPRVQPQELVQPVAQRPRVQVVRRPQLHLERLQQVLLQEIALPSPSPSPSPQPAAQAAPAPVMLQVNEVNEGNQVLQPEPPELEEEEEGEDEEEDEEEVEGEEGVEGGNPDQPPRVDEALFYLRVIKQTFQDDVPVYHRFLEIMKEFRGQRLETPDVIEQVAELLYSSPNLVLGFNTFLPAGYRISMADNGRYLFTSPDHEPKTLLSPQERAVLYGNDEEEGREDDEDEVRSDIMEEDDQGPEDPLIEEVVRDDEESGAAPVQDRQEGSSDDDALRVVELLQKCFHARPGKLVCFTTFMDMLIASQKYKRRLERQIAEEAVQDAKELEDDSNQPGPAPAQQAPVDENMEVEEEEREPQEEPRPEVRVISDQERLDCISREHDQFIISLAAKACMGEPDLLAALIDFLPYLRKLLENGSELVMQKINAILDFKPTNNEPIDSEMADKELTDKMEQANMGTSKNEKLVIRKPEEPGSSDEMLVLQKSYRILYEKLKLRTTSTQIGQLVVLLNMFLNMDISKHDLVIEVPRIMGRQGSEVESLILNLLGMNKDPKDFPENDVDAVLRKDMPPVRAKRGLRVQKLMPQIKTADVATVCTLGPSYRLMKDPKEGECAGRIEMEDEIKETLNDKWSSWPSYSSEDTGTQQTKKSNLEEFHFRTEDERYELDIIVDSNRTIMEELDMTLRHYTNLGPEERKNYRFNDQLNCQSRATFFRVMQKVYTNSVLELVDAVKNNPISGLAKIINGLQEKDAQWSRFQQDANRTWRDALDKQLGASTALLTNQQKNYDQKAFKSKPLVNAIEQVFEDKKKAGDEDDLPHMTLEYSDDKKVYQDVNDVIHHFFHELPGGKHEGDRNKLVLFSFRVLMEWLCQDNDNVLIDEIVEKAFNVEEEAVPETSSGLKTEPNEAEKFRRDLYTRKRRVFYGDDAVYLVIRYYHMIQDRFEKLLQSQTAFSQEYRESQQKQNKWQAGIGYLSQAREVLEKNIMERKAAVEDIKNVRHCPSAYYTTTLRELKQLGSAQTDIGAFEDTVRNLFPGDVPLFTNIDKLFISLAKNIHHASCADGKENPISLYLKYRKRLIETEDGKEREAVEQEYAQAAEEVLRGKNTYRFEFINESKPFVNIWVIPREEKESEEDDDDEEGGNDDKDDNNDKNDEEEEDKENEQDEEMPPNNEDDNEEEEEEDGSEEDPSGAEAPGEEEMDVETKSSPDGINQELKSIPNYKSLLSQIKISSHKKFNSFRGIEKISKTRIIRARDCDKLAKQQFTQPILPLIYA